MAPALTLTPREPPDAVLDVENTFTIRRRALASVDNLSTHMEEDDMGLQNTPSLVKDSQEMEQILVDLGSSDLAQADLLQAIKTLESGGDVLSTGDADVIFPGFDLAEAVDSEGDAAEDKIRLMQARLERRCSFLQRRLRILQARAIGKRVSEEAAVTFEKCIRGARKDGGGRPMGLKALLKKVETTAALQASASSRSTVGPTYFNAGSSKGDASKSASIGIPAGTLAGLEDTAGALRSHLSVLKRELDSDATASSSGAESNDEAVNYNNPHQQPMPIDKRALWTWQRARASIASRWTWLQAQVQELEYKIRQHNDLHNQVREAKGPVQFVGEPAAYQGSLPGSNLPEEDPASETCARVRPLDRETFKKRKLLLMHNLHIATSKATKPTDILCSCQHPIESCPVCVGRADPRLPLPPFSTLSASQKVALVDPSFHPVLSETRDISPGVHLSALSSRAWFVARLNKPARGGHHAAPGARHKPAAGAAPPPKLKRGRPPLTRKVRDREHGKEKEKDEDSTATVTPVATTTTATTASESSGRRGRASTESRRRPSYDIDNIVIPQSVAANTRPLILSYKEIVTPKWRVMEIPRVNLNNGVSKMMHRISMDSDEEDISDEAILSRHTRAEHRERSRYMRKQRARRSQQDAAAAVAAAAAADPPPAAPPPPAVPPVTQPVEASEIIRPYSPRQFPLPEDTYATMLSAMPDGYYPSSPEPTIPIPSPLMEDDERTSTISSPLSPLIFEGDDPDDVEWDPSSEKAERRKSGFR